MYSFGGEFLHTSQAEWDWVLLMPATKGPDPPHKGGSTAYERRCPWLLIFRLVSMADLLAQLPYLLPHRLLVDVRTSPNNPHKRRGFAAHKQ